ncbi:CAT RNA binding domain-containing protein [Streptococcus thermophilus]|nr:CAT RNA binding domain-containing protein [Streptococcus thermophilus]MDA5520818.1 CAT RNA binding domain-containing protein [Streptococcus thermophilus]
MGKGLGFQKKIGETVNKEKIEKTFDLCLGKSGDSGQMDSCLCRFA